MSSKFNYSTKLQIRCEKGHNWKPWLGNIKRGKWCPICGIEKRAKSQANGIEDCQMLAKKRSGLCLSKTYKNVGTPIRWQCKNGHRWYAPYRQVKGTKNRAGTWCPKCNSKKLRNITYARTIAKELGWVCLSNVYVNYNEKMKWKCSFGHEFEQSLAKAVSRKKCPKCNINFGEEILRFFLESIFEKPFPKVRPNFLKIKKGVFLELDGYNEKLKIAFEHHGLQHYKFNERFHKNKKDFTLRKKVDKLKAKLCRQNGVRLLTIPSIPEITKVNDVGNLLNSEFNRLKIPFNVKKIPKTIELHNFQSHKKIKELNSVAQSRGGKLLSKTYLGSEHPLKWMCKVRHNWYATPENIVGSKSKKGTWCPDCRNISRSVNQRSSIEDMKDLAFTRNGFCLSKKYVNARTKLKWKCSEMHIWEAVPNAIQQGSWCPYCAGKIVSIDTINTWAKKFGGACKSKEYLRNSLKLRWSCKNNHVWDMALNKMQRRVKESKYWCSECARKNRK